MRKIITTAWFFLLILFFPMLSIAQESTETNLFSTGMPQNLDLYLVIGQSNMAGRAEIRAQDMTPLEKVYLFTGDTGTPWVRANNPLNRFSTIRKVISMQRLSPAYSFAKTMATSTKREIGLVVNARGGTSIVQWLPGTHYYQEAIQRTKQAMQYGTLKGIIWHQGESDSDSLRTSMYLGRLEILINAFREEFENPMLPLVAGQVSEDRERRIPFNNMILELPDFIRYTRAGLLTRNLHL